MVQVSRYPQRHARHVYRPQRTLQTLALSRYGCQRPVGFFSLPVEIRNIIMELALVPGEIQLHATETDENPHRGLLYKYLSKREKSKFSLFFQPPGFQLLATCKQACAEGYEIFFSKNLFYLPWGLVENVHDCFDQINVEHQSMMRSVGLMLGLQDLALESSSGFQLVLEVTAVLDITWVEKLEWMRAHATGMRLVKIENAAEVLEFEGRELEDALAWVGRHNDCCTPVELLRLVQDAVDNGTPTEVLRLVQDVRKYVTEDVMNMINCYGWKVFKTMVNKGEFRTL